MTNAELIDKIREEILHLKMKELQRTNGINTGADVYLSSYAVLSLIEKKKESLHIPEICKENADSFTSDLEDAADNHIRRVADAAGHPGWDWTTQDIADAFIAGAKWQEDKIIKSATDLIQLKARSFGKSDTIALGGLIKLAADRQKEQMMKEAVDMTLCNLSLGNHTEKVLAFGDRFPNGKKCRIIIVNEDEK